MTYLVIGIGIMCGAVLFKVEKRRQELMEEIAEIRKQAANY